MTNQTISRKQACVILKINMTALGRLIQSGLLKEYIDNRRMRYMMKDEVEAFLKKQDQLCPKCGKTMTLYQVSVLVPHRRITRRYKCYFCGAKQDEKEQLNIIRRRNSVKPLLMDLRTLNKLAMDNAQQQVDEFIEAEQEKYKEPEKNPALVEGQAFNTAQYLKTAEMKADTKFVLIYGTLYREFVRRPLITNARKFANDSGLKVGKIFFFEHSGNDWLYVGTYHLPSLNYETQTPV